MTTLISNSHEISTPVSSAPSAQGQGLPVLMLRIICVVSALVILVFLANHLIYRKSILWMATGIGVFYSACLLAVALIPRLSNTTRAGWTIVLLLMGLVIKFVFPPLYIAPLFPHVGHSIVMPPLYWASIFFGGLLVILALIKPATCQGAYTRRARFFVIVSCALCCAAWILPQPIYLSRYEEDPASPVYIIRDGRQLYVDLHLNFRIHMPIVLFHTILEQHKKTTEIVHAAEESNQIYQDLVKKGRMAVRRTAHRPMPDLVMIPNPASISRDRTWSLVRNLLSPIAVSSQVLMLPLLILLIVFLVWFPDRTFGGLKEITKWATAMVLLFIPVTNVILMIAVLTYTPSHVPLKTSVHFGLELGQVMAVITVLVAGQILARHTDNPALKQMETTTS